jgi:hypothetical protein
MPMACQEHLKELKNHINLSLSLVETGVPGEKPLQAKLRADYFSLSLFLYLQTLGLVTVFTTLNFLCKLRTATIS